MSLPPETVFSLGLEAANSESTSPEEMLENFSKAQSLFRCILYSEFSGPNDITNLMKDFVDAVDDFKGGTPDAQAKVTTVRQQLNTTVLTPAN